MILSDQRRLLLRSIFMVLAAYLFIISIINFYRYASSPTDENLFSNTQSTAYVIKSFPGQLGRPLPTLKARQEIAIDSVLVGDLVLNAARKKLRSRVDAQRILRVIPSDSTFDLEIFRPTNNRTVIYRVQKSAMPDSFLRELPPVVNVTDVYKDGASDRAGMKVGDLIFRINGKNFKNAAEADFILRSGQTGKTIAYEVIRNNRSVTLQVQLAQFGVPVAQLIFFLSGLVFFGVGTFLTMKQPEVKAIRLIGLAMQFIGFYMMVAFYRRQLEPGAFFVIRDLTMLVTLFLGLAIWFHSSYYFPKVRPELLQRRWMQYVPYGFAAIFMAIALYAGPPQNNPLSALVLVGMLLLSTIYAAIISFIFRKQRTPEHKKLSRIIQWTGISVGVTITVMVFIFGNNQRAGFIGIPFILIPLSYLYTIGRYRLFDMNLRIGRNIQYTVASTVWVAFLLIVSVRILLSLASLHFDLPNVRFSVTSVEVLDTPSSPEQHDLQERGIMMLFALVIGLTAWKAGQAGQRFIDKQFDRAAYDYRRAASELAEVMATKLSMGDLARGIVQKLSEIMHLRKVGVLFFRNQKDCCCQEADGFDGQEWKEFCMDIDHRLVPALEKFRSDSRLSVDYLPPDLQDSFREHGFRHVIPIRFKEKLVGTLLIGEKLSEAPFHNEDLSFLAAVAKQASVSIENAFLYEGLAEQERLKHELAIARRIQLASLPQTTPKVDGLDIAGISIPATEVGGDYFDYLNGVPNEITIIVGDVSGKGTSAALYMSKVQGILRSLHGMGLSPRDLFVRVNHLLCQDMDRKSFVTTLGADFDASARSVVLARAGHLPLFYFNSQTQKVEMITPKGLGFGLDDEGVFATELEEKTIGYRAGDIFLFITDGITEAHNRTGGEFGEEMVSSILQNSASLNADQIRDKIISEVKRFGAGTQQHDDQTIVVVKAR